MKNGLEYCEHKKKNCSTAEFQFEHRSDYDWVSSWDRAIQCVVMSKKCVVCLVKKLRCHKKIFSYIFNRIYSRARKLKIGNIIHDKQTFFPKRYIMR